MEEHETRLTTIQDVPLGGGRQRRQISRTDLTLETSLDPEDSRRRDIVGTFWGRRSSPLPDRDGQ